MTHLVMDEQPARHSRFPIYGLIALVVAFIGLLVWGWLHFTNRPDPVAEIRSSAPPPAPSELPLSTGEPVQNAPPPLPTPTPPAPTPPPTAPTSAVSQLEKPPKDQARALLAEVDALVAEGRLQTAREKALAAIDEATDPETRSAAEAVAGKIGVELVLTPRPMPEKIDYIVQPGDSLDKIARRNGTTVELLQKSNQLRGPVIRPGDRLRVFTGAWSIRVNKTRNDLVLFLNDRFFKRYRVGTGEYAKTPVGEFKIVDRIAQPTWWHPDGRTIPYGDPQNLLGTHWLALDIKGYGLHGTWEPETIGRQSSMGCVRLLNEDIEELYTLVTIGTPVIIED